jgi:hypothetical protein
MPLHGVVGEGRILFTVGVAPTELHQTKGPCYRAVRGQRKEDKKKMMSATSRWSLALLGCRRYAGWHASPSVHGTEPKDH